MQDLPQDPATPDEGTPVTPPDGVHERFDDEVITPVTGDDPGPDVTINPTDASGDPTDNDGDAPDLPPNLPPGSTTADPTDDKGL